MGFLGNGLDITPKYTTAEMTGTSTSPHVGIYSVNSQLEPGQPGQSILAAGFITPAVAFDSPEAEQVVEMMAEESFKELGGAKMKITHLLLIAVAVWFFFLRK